jgi:hypothetical protein
MKQWNIIEKYMRINVHWLSIDSSKKTKERMLYLVSKNEMRACVCVCFFVAQYEKKDRNNNSKANNNIEKQTNNEEKKTNEYQKEKKCKHTKKERMESK